MDLIEKMERLLTRIDAGETSLEVLEEFEQAQKEFDEYVNKERQE